MNTDFFNNASKQMESLAEPMRKYAQLMVNHGEKLAHFHFESARSYSQMSLNQLRSMLDVNDARSLQDYLSEQGKLATSVNQRLTEDAQTLANMGREFSEEAQKLIQEGASQVTETAKQGAKQATEAATEAAAPQRKSA